jgi:hypothetical protein
MVLFLLASSLLNKLLDWLGARRYEAGLGGRITERDRSRRPEAGSWTIIRPATNTC